MSDLKLTLRLSADGSVLKGELRTASGEVRAFGGEAEKTGERAERGFGKARKGVESISDSLNRLQRVVGVLAAVGISARAIQSIGRASDLYSNLYAQIGLVTASALQQSEAFDEVLDIANRTGQAMDSVTRLATRSIRALESSGESADEATRKGLALTDAISDAVRVSQAPVAETTAAIIQLSQGLGAGALRGEEFNSVMEQTPRVAQAISDALGVTLGELRELANDGQLTTEVVTNALLSQAATLKAEAEDIPRTIAESWRALSNEVTAYIGQASKATGAGETIADSLFEISENLDAVFSALLIAVQALTLAIAGRLVSAIAAWTAANVVLTPSIAGATAATLRLNAALLASLVQMRAVAAATALARGGFALIGGPVGALTIGAGLLTMQVLSYRRELEALRAPSEEAAALLERLQEISEKPIEPSIDLSPFQAGISELKREIAETEAELDRLQERRMERLRNPAPGVRGDVAAFTDPVGTGSTAQEDALQAGISEKASQLDELQKEFDEVAEAARKAWAEMTPDQRDAEATRLLGESLDWMGGLATAVGDNAAEAFAKWRQGVEGAGAANRELIEPLEQQVTKLQQELFVLEEVAAGRQTAAMATLQFQQAEAMAQATTEADKRAIQEKYAELQRLTGEIELARAAQERKTQAERDAEKASREHAQQIKSLAGTYRQLLSATNPLAAQQLALNEQLAGMQQLAALGAEELADMGINAQLLEQVIAGLQQELAGLGGDSSVLPGADVESYLDLLDDVKSKMEEIADIEWGIDSLIDSFHPLAGEMRRLGEEIAFIDRALSEGVIGNAQAGFMKIGAAADAAFGAMMAGVDRSSKEYKQLEVAQQAVNVALGIAAILQQGMGDPYTAIPRMIAMAAMVAQLVDGIAGLSGGSDPTERRQKTQGTGTILGDAEADSESIANATQITADATRELVGISRAQLRALQRLESGISGASTLLARGAGQFEVDLSGMGTDTLGRALQDIFDPLGGPLAKLLAKLLGGSAKVIDEGIRIVGGTFQEMIDEVLVQAFQEVRVKKNVFSSSKTKLFTEELDDEVARQFQLIFESIADTVAEGAVALGLSRDEIERAIAEFQVQEQLISLEGLSAEEQQAELEAVFGAIFDSLVGSVVPFIAQFQEVGEGLGETLVRVATSVQVTQEAMHRLGLAIDETDPERLAQIAVGLVDAAGGIEGFINGMQNFVQKFAPEAHVVALAGDDLTRALEQVGLSVPGTRDEMWALMQSLDASTAAGAEQIAMLFELTDAADTYYKHLEAVQSERLGLERQILALQGDTAALRQLELEKLDESNRALQERIWALENEAELADLMAGVTNDIAQLSLSPLRREFRQLSLAHRDLVARAKELGASEDYLARIRYAHDLQLRQLAVRLEESIQSLWEQLQGSNQVGGGAFGSSFTSPIEDAARQIRDSLVRALEGVDEWLRRSAFEDPSLTGRQRFAALQAEFDRLVNIALTGTGAAQADAVAQLPEIASALEALGVQMHGSATEPFQEFRQGLIAAMEQVAAIAVPEEPDPVTGTQVGQIGAGVDQLASEQRNTTAIAAQLLETLGVLVEVSGRTAIDLAEALGVPLSTVIQNLIGEVEAGSLETVEQLVAVANTLGLDLAVLADEIGYHIGELRDQESLLSQSLQNAVMRMPPEIQAQLWGPLDRIWSATTEADANAALADLLAATDDLPVEYRNALAPFFDAIDTQDLHLAELGLLDTIRSILAGSAMTLTAIKNALSGDPTTPPDASYGPAPTTPPPGFADGGWASGLIMTGERGPEVVVPHDISRFFQRVGWPINAGGGDDPRIANYLHRLVEQGEEAARQRDEHAERQIVAVDSLSSAVMDAARLEASNRGLVS